MKATFQKRDYTNYISLGYFCEVASDLEKMGLRSFSSPFDWGLSNFPRVIEALDRKFEGFMDYENLYQNKAERYHYRDSRYRFYSFHDFNEYESLEAQYDKVMEKYHRRIDRLLNAIESPTLFIRYISSEVLDESGKSKELSWIEQSYSFIMNVLKHYNSENEIVFIGDETVISDEIKIYHVPCDKGDKVSRSPITNNDELYPLLLSVEFPDREANIRRYKSKPAKNDGTLYARIQRKIIYYYGLWTGKIYRHDKTYNIPGK